MNIAKQRGAPLYYFPKTKLTVASVEKNNSTQELKKLKKQKRMKGKKPRRPWRPPTGENYAVKLGLA